MRGRVVVLWRVVPVLLAVAACALASPSARAGEWMQLSCANPDGSSSNSEGWSGAASGPFATGASATTSCNAAYPLSAAFNVIYGTPPSVGSMETIAYTPPAASTLVGGSADVTLEAYASGPQSAPAFSVAQVLSPDQGGPLEQCAGAANGCRDLGAPFNGVVALPSNRGGQFLAQVACGDLVQTTDPCSEGAQNGVYDRAEVHWAHFLLLTEARPRTSDFRGTALQRNARGTASLLFDASDPVGSGDNPPSGPGIYAVAVKVDGATVYSGVPDSNGGACVPVGTDPATGALMFDHAQPCPPSETVQVPVPTSHLPDGRHRLQVSVVDAAGGVSPALDQYISTLNPQITPVPRDRRSVRARFVISWSWRRTRTTLRFISVQHLPRRGHVSLRCAGHGCPRVAGAATGKHGVQRLLRRLHNRRFHAGERLLISVAAPHRRTERIELEIRRGRVPRARLRR